MNEHRHKLIVAAVTALLAGLALLSTPGFAADSHYKLDSPEDVIAALNSGLVRISSAGGATGVSDRYEKLRPLILATHDLPYIARLTVRRQWSGLDAMQRMRFVAAFERLSIMTYAARFKNVGQGTFKVKGTSDAGGGRVQVSSVIVRPDKDDIPLDYVLHEHDGIWQIVNIVADGVSDLALKHAEYQRILAKGTIDDLIRHLHEQADRLRQGEPAQRK
jgi:phospholipid transport system substrate-binding protein